MALLRKARGAGDWREEEIVGADHWPIVLGAGHWAELRAAVGAVEAQGVKLDDTHHPASGEAKGSGQVLALSAGEVDGRGLTVAWPLAQGGRVEVGIARLRRLPGERAQATWLNGWSGRCVLPKLSPSFPRWLPNGRRAPLLLRAGRCSRRWLYPIATMGGATHGWPRVLCVWNDAPRQSAPTPGRSISARPSATTFDCSSRTPAGRTAQACEEFVRAASLGCD